MESRDWSSDVCSSDLFPSHDTNNATGSAGQVLATNGTSTYWLTITGTVGNGSATNSTLYWNGSNWTENLNFFADQNGNLLTNGSLTVVGTSTLATTTITNASIANAVITNATATNLYSTNGTIANLVNTNATSSNLFATLS